MAGINYASVSMSASDGVQGRKRNVTMAGMDSSPGSIEDVDDNDALEERKRQPVKRACNECRQQKVRAMRCFMLGIHWQSVDRHWFLTRLAPYSFDAMSSKNPGPIVRGAVG